MLEKGFSRYYLDRDAPKRDPEQLRLVRSLALSSSCDCGATCPPPGSILVRIQKIIYEHNYFKIWSYDKKISYSKYSVYTGTPTLG